MEFQGFQNILPASVVFIVIIGLIALSWFSYRKTRTLPVPAKTGLIALRAAALIILFLLLMNPYFYSSSEIEIKPRIAVFLDNSESVSIQKGEYQGRDSYEALLNELDFQNRNTFDFDYYSIGTESKETAPDSLSLDEPQTNLSAATDKILELEDGVKAGIMITDGIITYGKDPSFAVSTSSYPVYTIGIGDTSNVRDISVSNILTNATGYTNTNQVIEAELSQSGFNGRTVAVSLMSGDEVLQEQNISFDTDNQVKTAEFELELQEPGLKQFKIRVSPLDEEWTEANNQNTFSINVLDSKVRILHVAFKVHPDVRMLRSVISEDANNELTTLTWLGGNNFVESLPSETDFNLIIIHGVPESSISGFTLLDDISETPTILMSLGDYRQSPLEAINQARIIEPISNRNVQITLNQLMDGDQQPIMELPSYNPADLPTLYGPLRSSNREPQSENLYSSNFQNVDTESPVISVLEQGNIRRAHVNAWGWYRLYQSPVENQRQLAVDLFSNIVSWTSSDPDNRNLQISPARQSFTTSERPSINASLQNESGAPESDAIIEVQINSENGNSRSFNMNNEGNGNYSLELPNLSEGLYTFDAAARRGNREIDQQSGEFIVSNASTELTNINRNDKLLQSIADNTGASSFTYNNIDAFWDSLRVNNVFEAQTEVIENYQFPVRSIPWFVVVLLLLGTEWLLRKYYSLP